MSGTEIGVDRFQLCRVCYVKNGSRLELHLTRGDYQDPKLCPTETTKTPIHKHTKLFMIKSTLIPLLKCRSLWRATKGRCFATRSRGIGAVACWGATRSLLVCRHSAAPPKCKNRRLTQTVFTCVSENVFRHLLQRSNFLKRQ